MRVLSSARKHGITDNDMLHAVRNSIIAADLDEGKTLYLGPAADGALLEIIAVLDDDPRVIHAMRASRKYLPNH